MPCTGIYFGFRCSHIDLSITRFQWTHNDYYYFYFLSFFSSLPSCRFCSATLSFVIVLICVMCYCFNRSINKSSMALYRQRLMQSMNEHNVDIYTVEQVNECVSILFYELVCSCVRVKSPNVNSLNLMWATVCVSVCVCITASYEHALIHFYAVIVLRCGTVCATLPWVPIGAARFATILRDSDGVGESVSEQIHRGMSLEALLQALARWKRMWATGLRCKHIQWQRNGNIYNEHGSLNISP